MTEGRKRKGMGQAAMGGAEETWEINEPLQIELQWHLSWWEYDQGRIEAEHLSTGKKRFHYYLVNAKNL